jgi:hypothetical protein
LPIASAAVLIAAALPITVQAQQPDATPPPPPAPSAGAETPAQPSVTEELIRMLADHNALSKEDAQKLLQRLQAQKAAQAQAASRQPAGEAQDNEGATEAQSPPPEKKGRVRVMYVPESEKEKISKEVEQKVIETAKAENWAQPYGFPDWLKRISLNGDFRLRQEFDYLDSANYPGFINFQAINSGAPYDTSNASAVPPPFLNSTENRALLRFRARLGILAQINDELTAGFRLSSGNTTNPVSTNQTLGTDFNKTTLVIDRAYLEYQPLPYSAAAGLTLWGGRMPNPFFSTSLVWDDDLNFDGVAGRYQYSWTPFLKPYVTLGAFSVENTDFNFPSTSAVKGSSRDKWLFASQLGVDWKIHKNLKTHAAAAYYYFYHLDGQESPPCQDPLSAAVSCPTDDTRPLFVQKGNTLFPLRDIALTDPSGPTYQYFGLASPFRELDVTAAVDYLIDEDRHLIVTADYVNNLAFNEAAVRSKAPVTNFATDGTYAFGHQGYLVQVMAGYPKLGEAWEWNTTVGYRLLGTDAVVDAFTDSDFHLGGTNAKGYYLEGGLGVMHNAWLVARWLSAREATGAPFSADVLQLDFNARF